MASSEKVSSNRFVRRAIPRLKTTKSADGGGKSDPKARNNASPTTDLTPGSGCVDKPSSGKKTQSPESGSDQPTRRSLPVKGTSKQDTVTSARRSEESKRKRQQSPAILEVKDPATKRNQARELHKEKTKCQVAFSTKPETRFSGGNSDPVFTAKGSTSKTKRYSLADLRRKEAELQRRVDELETRLHAAQAAKDSSIKELEIQLDSLKEASEKLEEEKQSLEKKLDEKETYYQETIADQRKTLLTKNENLVQKINDCQAKLLECSINPVSLKPLTPEAEEKENLTTKGKEAADKAVILKDKLTDMMDKNKEYLQDIQKITEELQK